MARSSIEAKQSSLAAKMQSSLSFEESGLPIYHPDLRSAKQYDFIHKQSLKLPFWRFIGTILLLTTLIQLPFTAGFFWKDSFDAPTASNVSADFTQADTVTPLTASDMTSTPGFRLSARSPAQAHSDAWNARLIISEILANKEAKDDEETADSFSASVEFTETSMGPVVYHHPNTPSFSQTSIETWFARLMLSKLLDLKNAQDDAQAFLDHHPKMVEYASTLPPPLGEAVLKDEADLSNHLTEQLEKTEEDLHKTVPHIHIVLLASTSPNDLQKHVDAYGLVENWATMMARVETGMALDRKFTIANSKFTDPSKRPHAKLSNSGVIVNSLNSTYQAFPLRHEQILLGYDSGEPDYFSENPRDLDWSSHIGPRYFSLTDEEMSRVQIGTEAMPLISTVKNHIDPLYEAVGKLEMVKILRCVNDARKLIEDSLYDAASMSGIYKTGIAINTGQQMRLSSFKNHIREILKRLGDLRQNMMCGSEDLSRELQLISRRKKAGAIDENETETQSASDNTEPVVLSVEYRQEICTSMESIVHWFSEYLMLDGYGSFVFV